MLEVDELFKENNLSVVVDGATTRVEKQGLYDFDANQPSVKVLDGKAGIYEGDQRVNLKKGHEALLAEAPQESQISNLKSQKFDKNQVKNDPLYRWSDLRSEYSTNSNVAEANALMAEGGWWGPGWYWDPFWYDFAFMPGWRMGMMWGPFLAIVLAVGCGMGSLLWLWRGRPLLSLSRRSGRRGSGRWDHAAARTSARQGFTGIPCPAPSHGHESRRNAWNADG